MKTIVSIVAFMLITSVVSAQVHTQSTTPVAADPAKPNQVTGVPAVTTEVKPDPLTVQPAKAIDATPPVLSEVDALKLTNIVLSLDNAQLQIAQIQAQAKELQTQAQTLFQSLQKPGFTLTRNQQGAWVYVAAEKK
jgi:hypothetical protein